MKQQQVLEQHQPKTLGEVVTVEGCNFETQMRLKDYIDNNYPSYFKQLTRHQDFFYKTLLLSVGTYLVIAGNLQFPNDIDNTISDINQTSVLVLENHNWAALRNFYQSSQVVRGLPFITWPTLNHSQELDFGLQPIVETGAFGALHLYSFSVFLVNTIPFLSFIFSAVLSVCYRPSPKNRRMYQPLRII